MKRMSQILAASILAAFASAAAAQSGGDVDGQVAALDKTGANRGQALVASKIASNFTNLAGSEDNALALVNALRTGESVQLTYAPAGTSTTPTISTLDPPTGKMGWGNVKISLALAQDQLARLGITNPTAEQLQAALNGGDITVTNADGTTTTSTLRGVLQMRADGMGWGQIAKAGGTKVGPVVSQLKMANTKVASIPPTTAEGTAATTKASAAAKSKGITTATGATTTATGGKHVSKGIVTATGSSQTVGSQHGSKGITTASGVANPASSRGLMTAEGAVAAGRGNGNAYGRGIVTATGGGATNAAATAHGRGSGGGAGLVTGSGSGAGSVTTAHGNAGGNGKGNAGGNAGGNGRGKGG